MNEHVELKELRERVKKLETLQRNFRIAMIVVVGFMIYDALSPDTGSDILFAHKVKARQFELADGAGTIFGYWTKSDDGQGSVLRVQSTDGSYLELSPKALTIHEMTQDQLQREYTLTASGLPETGSAEAPRSEAIQ